MNLGQLRTAVRERCGVLATDQMAGDTAMLTLINEAIHLLELEAVNGWRWNRRQTTFPTVAGDGGYNLSDAETNTASVIVTKVLDLWVSPTSSSGLYRMKRLSREEVNTVWRADGVNNFPQVWAIEGNTIQLGPIPNDAYTITMTYQRGEDDLAADGDEPLMPARYHGAIVEKAAELLLRRIGDLPRAQIANASVKEWITRIRRTHRLYGGGGRVRETWSEDF